MFRVGLSRLVNCQTTRGLSTASAASKLNSGLEKFKEFLNSDATKRAVKVAMTELRPPTPAEIPRAIRDGIRIFTKGNWRELTVREAWLNTLVTTEVICWFFVGEVIGKGTLIGYQV